MEEPDAQDQAQKYFNTNLLLRISSTQVLNLPLTKFQAISNNTTLVQDALRMTLANAQDGSGYQNADFMTPPDGQNGRMRMYLWNIFRSVMLVLVFTNSLMV